MIDAKTWENIKAMVVTIAAYEEKGIEFDFDIATTLGYTELEQKIAQQIIQIKQPIPDVTLIKILKLLHSAPCIPKFVYLAELQLVFLVWHDSKFFTVIDETGL
jgi:hypothetical protein